MNNKIIFSMSKVGKVLPNKKWILKDISLSFFYGAKIGILGSNGSGKSTLLKIMAGVEAGYLGDITFAKGYSVGLLEQEPTMDGEKTVKEVVQEGVQEVVNLLAEFDDVNARFATELSDDEMTTLLARQGELQDKLDLMNAWDLDSRLELAMDSLRCPPEETKVKVLSGGERRRVALCRLLLSEPDILLLDEPTNHLDAETVFWLERHLQNYKGTIIAVTHDRYFLDNVAGWILELDRGEGIPFEGNYSSWLEQKQSRLAREEKTESKRQKMLGRELEWIRSNSKARHTKSKARIDNYYKMLEDSKENKADVNDLAIPAGPRLGENVIEALGISKCFDDKILYENLNFKLPAGGIIGVIGPNGAGKSTLFKIMTGEAKPDAGEIKIGETVKISYTDQNRDFDGKKTILEVMSEGKDFIEVAGRTINARAYIGKFNFVGEDQKKFMNQLSGGERNRIHLAQTLKDGGNVLLLDEPTNDLDVHTLQALENAIMDFAGCVVVISHDRYFLDRIATHILAFEGNGEVAWFEGNWSQYEEDRQKRLGEAASRPHRMSYKKLTRD